MPSISFDTLDNELVVLDEDDNVVHVFERGHLSRAAYQYMTHWVRENTMPEDDSNESWERAETAWDSLNPEFQATLVAISRQEQQQAQDIRDGLLATLHGYQGVSNVKRVFADAIRDCFKQLC
jgi:hypothetical protein